MVLYNDTILPKRLLRKYLDEGEPVHFRADDCPKGVSLIPADLLADTAAKRTKGDALARSFIRHSPEKLAASILAILEE